MKKLSVFLAAIAMACSFSNSEAKTVHHKAINKSTPTSRAKAEYLNHITAIINKQQATHMAKAGAAAKTTAATENLIAYSSYDFNPEDIGEEISVANDSATFVYSGTRGSHFNNNIMGYYTITNDAIFEFNSLVIANSLGGVLMGNSFHPGYFNGLLDVAYDSMYSYSSYVDDTSGAPLGLYDIATIQYDSNNNVLNNTYYDYSFTPFAYQYSYVQTYGTANNILTGIETSSSAGAVDTSAITTYIYNDAGQLIRDSISTGAAGVYTPNFTVYYTYNAVGNLISAISYGYATDTTFPTERFDFFYNADNTLRKDSITDFETPGWVPIETDSIIYTPGVSYFTGYYSVNFNGIISSARTIEYVTKHINAAGLVDTMKDYIYYTDSTITGPSEVSGTQDIFIYDAAGNPTSDYTYKYEGSPSIFGNTFSDSALYIYKYYYSAPLAVKTVEAAAPVFTVYPNPATNQVYITRTGAVNRTQSVIRLLNVNGQAVKSLSCTWQSASQVMPIADLPSGMYWLQVQDNDGKSSFTQKIIKQ